MLMTLESFCTLLRRESPSLMQVWYCAFLQSGRLVITIPPTLINKIGYLLQVGSGIYNMKVEGMGSASNMSGY